MIVTSDPRPQTVRSKTVRGRSRLVQRKLVASLVCGGAVIAAIPVADAWSLGVDKWWTNKFGEFDSSRWTTQRSATQRLIVDRCNHNWGQANQVVEIELRQDRSWAPDVSHGSFKYGCNAGDHTSNAGNDTDKTWVSGSTGANKYFFKWDPDVDLRSSGIIEIDHS